MIVNRRIKCLDLMLAAPMMALLLLQAPAQAAVSFDAERLARFDALVAEKMTWSGVTPAFSILIDQGGQTVYERHHGYADISKRLVATRNTIYRIGSITKSYTALAVLQLVEQGRIDLDAQLSSYLKEFQSRLAAVTIRQLLTHTAGVPNYTSFPEAMQVLVDDDVSHEAILAIFKDKPLDFDPGTAFNYSNSGYHLLGLVIEAVTGKDYFEHIQSKIFDTLGLEATYTGDLSTALPHRARGYYTTPSGFATAPMMWRLGPYAAGALETTAGDLVKFRRAVFNSPAISDELRSLITTTGRFPDGTVQHYALGALTVDEFHGHQRVHHNGVISGFSSQHDYYPEEDITVVVLVSSDGAPQSASNLSIKLVREIFDIPQPNVSTVEVNEALLATYAGQYRMHPFRVALGDPVRVVLSDGSLHLQLNDDAENPALMQLLPRSNGEFGLPVDDETSVRFRTHGNEVAGLEIITAGSVIPGARVDATE